MYVFILSKQLSKDTANQTAQGLQLRGLLLSVCLDQCRSVGASLIRTTIELDMQWSWMIGDWVTTWSRLMTFCFCGKYLLPTETGTITQNETTKT